MGIRTTNGRISDGLLRAIATAGCPLLLAALGACASTTRDFDDLAADQPAAHFGAATRDAYLSSTDVDAAGYGAFSRHVNSTSGFLGNLLKTYITDPLVRPLSTARSLGYLIKNTIVDFSKEVVISMVSLPQVSKKPIQPIATGPGMDLEAWERDLDGITGSKPSTGSLEFLIDGDEYFAALLDGIETANESIHLRTYIFDNDDFAVQVADLLKRRSLEIDVRVSMDGIGTLTGALGNPGDMPAAFDPPPSIAEYLSRDSNVAVRTLTNPWFSGDHTKVTILDRSTAFVGGMNIGREYRYDWHDLMVKVEGGVVLELARDGDDAWAKSGILGDLAALFRYFNDSTPPVPDNGYPVRVLVTRAQHSQIYETQLAAIRRAQKYIYIENPYFSDDAVLFELIAARRRGVDVRFVIAEKGDMMLMDMSNVHAVNAMLANGIRVYMYPQMTHVKAALVDDWLMVGSANLDKLSMRINKEINIATSHPEAVSALKKRLFQADFERSQELTTPLPAGLGNHFAEAVADVFL